MYNYNYYYFGMHLAWWIIWVFVILLIVAIPYDFPFQRNKMDSEMDILRKRFASGQISKEEYQDKRAFLKGNK